MRRFQISLWVIFLLLIMITYSEAQLIGGYQLIESGGASGIPITGLDYDIFYDASSVIFDDLILSTDSIGQEFSISSGAGFNNFVDFLTNGTNETIIFQHLYFPTRYSGAIGGRQYRYESNFNGSNIDFQNYSVNSLGLQVNSIYFNTPGSNPNHDGLWTDYVYDITLNVYGDVVVVPEPVSSILFLAGGATLIGRKYIKRKKIEV